MVVWEYMGGVFFFEEMTAYEISACLVGSEMCIGDRRGSDRRVCRVVVLVVCCAVGGHGGCGVVVVISVELLWWLLG